MGRRPQPEIREQLLDACTDWSLRHGLPDRLGPLATGVHSSPRMLLYHFATKTDLQRAILRRARGRQRAFYGELLALQPGEPYPVTLRRAFGEMTAPSARPYLEMFGRLREADGEPLWPGFGREATTDWLEPLREGLATVGRPELATLVLAVIRGLIMDLEATDDALRVGRAFDDFIDSLEAVAG